ncbi:hypothetical protein PV736_02170 [Streptomyces scabiei]|uniref:hypothetical protein n=1 Tax=Streptomyces scabiei TaxID=1930 RepID=UPI0007C6F38B|nr:hypothetical protein [Streptomyces scabiei]MDX2657880.1 hypothetical protein [Streptomyces scabiei]MDX2724520.1 hypothetical protein [Streptomyces scabiei]MDX2869612.1 hypothetical protein [Streptomyces scabiei]MDX2887986.1 hypothetical protein [Streptomyces scabiei]MDX2891630.1 hypothetical protein [Streptomyces scabiei]
MSITFSTVGTCTAEASVCVEGYSPLDGRAHGDLDVVVYVCEAHHDTARTEWLAGLTPYSIPRARGRRCGQVTAFAEVPGLPVETEPGGGVESGAEPTPDTDAPGAAPVRLGAVVEDVKVKKVGKVMGFVGPYVQLRPVGGGVEWDARPERLRPVTVAEALSAGAAAANARSRGELP